MAIKDESENEKSLAEKFPDSTPAERRRFLIANDDDLEAAEVMLGEFLDWMKLHDDEDEDAKKLADVKDDWDYASKYALLKSEVTDNEKDIPRLFITGTEDGGKLFVDKKGNKSMLILAATLDTTIADADTYALAIAISLKRITDRNSMEKFNIALDVRAGEGWANPNAYNCGSMMKTISQLCNRLFPERLDTLVLFPVPTLATYVWTVMKPFLDPVTAEKVKVEGGSASRTCPIPDSLSQYYDSETLERMEKIRYNNQIF